MKKTSIVTVSLLLLLSTGASVVYENGSSPSNNAGDGMAAITSTESSASSSVGVGPEGEEYRLNFEERNSSCLSNQSETPRAVEFGKSSERFTVNFSGTVRTANPCVGLRQELKKSGNRTYSLQIKMVPSNSTCVQCVGAASYRTEFSSGEPFRINVRHEDREIETLEHPDFDDETAGKDPGNSKDEKNGSGIFSGLFRWFGGLFS